MEPKIIIVDRQKWFRGKGCMDSQLLKQDGRMCCLGFASIQCGMSPNDILGQPYNYCILSETPDILSFLNEDMYNPSDIGEKLTSINDALYLNENDRELKLNSILEQGDCPIRFKFIN